MLLRQRELASGHRTVRQASLAGVHAPWRAGLVALLLDLAEDSGVDGAGGRAFPIEIDALYCDVIVQRWEQFTGLKAERIAAPEETAHAER